MTELDNHVPDTLNEKAAVFGLGNMGFPLAQRIAAALPVLVSDLDPARLSAAEQSFGAVRLGQTADVAVARFIVLCLPHPAASLALLHQIKPYLRPDAVVIETSTVNPEDILRAAAVLHDHSATLIDASIMAGVSQMQDGTASLAIGGDADAIAAARPVLDAIAGKQVVFGPLGSGAAAKVINNAVAHAVMVVVAEAGAMAVANGVDRDKLVALLSDSQMGLHRPLTFRYAKRAVQGDFAGGMPLAAARKDSELALVLAQKSKIPLFAIQAAHTVYELGMASGYGDEDYAAVVKLWADWGVPAV